MWSEVASCLRQAVEDKVAPAFVFLAWRENEVFIHSAGQCDQHTVFDLASLTKPLATTLLALRLPIPWDTSLQQIWGSAVAEDKKNITILQLLRHSSGLPAWRPYYETLGKTEISAQASVLRQMLLNEPLVYMPGSQALYSDLGFMLLGLIVREQQRSDLHALFQQACNDLGIQEHPFYLPAGSQIPDNIASCGSQPLLGRMCIKGQVEDENAWAMGGVAPQAGLFGTAGSVREVMQKTYKRNVAEKLWPIERLDKVYQHPAMTSTRTAGFDTPSGPDSSAGSNYPAGLIGHLGFTGVSLWYQPQHDQGAVLLSNRVAYGRDNWKIRQLRPRLHNLVWPLLT